MTFDSIVQRLDVEFDGTVGAMIPSLKDTVYVVMQIWFS